MASKAKTSIIDCARAAAMACHSSASLMTQVRRSQASGISSEAISEAARLLRTAEALARQAVGHLTVGAGKGGGKSGTSSKTEASKEVEHLNQVSKGNLASGESRAASRRRKKRQSQNTGHGAMMVDTSTGEHGVGYDPLPPQPNNAFKVLSELNATLQGFGQKGPGAASSSCKYPVGATVTIHGLQSRTGLNGTAGTVIPDTSKKEDGRIAVKSMATTEELRLKESNLTLARSPLFEYPDQGMFEHEPCY
eukprot:8394700-Karenia_brevis.AAC.1